MVRRRALLTWLVAALAVFGGAWPALAAELPPVNQALLLLRVLAYDRNLSRRAGKRVAVIVVARAGDPRSRERADRLVEAFDEVAGKVVVAGLPVGAEALAVRDAAALQARLEASPAALVYLDEGLGPLVPELTAVTRRRGALSAAGDRALVEAGAAVAAVPRGDRAGVVVNLVAARQEGADLDAALLAVAELIRE